MLRLLPLLVVLAYADEAHLTTDDAGYLTVIQGFATKLQCAVDTCSDKVLWYKDDIVIFDGTTYQKNSGYDASSFILNHNVDIDDKRGCMGECNLSSDCESGHSCVDNQCCACKREEYSLILRNLSFEDSGRFRCQIAETNQLLEFQVEVLESGLRGGFHENISYDHSKCCEEKGISTMCKAMCKPSDMNVTHFDPTSCKTDDYKNFLSCATDGGKRSHVHCCRTQMVPSFCYDFCSGDFQMLRRSHRLCLYYLPEIFDCYNRAYLPFPDAPEDVVVNAVDEGLSVCWKPPPVQPTNKDYPVIDYTVFYRKMPANSLMPEIDDVGSFLNGADYVELTDIIDDDYDSGDHPPAISPPMPSTDKKPRKKRESVLLATDEKTETIGQKINFEQVTTNETCILLEKLSSETKYQVFVTARNAYGESVPSIRYITKTIVGNVSNIVERTMKCCSDAGYDRCSSLMCNGTREVTSLDIAVMQQKCFDAYPAVIPCVVDGRNHSECCREKGVSSNCIPFCEGNAMPLYSESKFTSCIASSANAIYECIRTNYDTHPSPPVNVTIDRITSNGGTLYWDPPLANGHLVISYTVLIQRNNLLTGLSEFTNVTSPYNIDYLQSDTGYIVAVRAHSEKGVSLTSTKVSFRTAASEENICPKGIPLMMNSGRPFLCDSQQRYCPDGFECIEFLDEGVCCPIVEGTVETFSQCCAGRGVRGNCLEACEFNATSFPDECSGDLKNFIQCGSDARDHSRCCELVEVSAECMSGCRHPFTAPEKCSKESSKYRYCYALAKSTLPNMVEELYTSFMNETDVHVEWSPSPNANNYQLIVVDNNNNSNVFNLSQTEKWLRDLKPSTLYHARVIALNSEGESPPSQEIMFHTFFADGNTNAPLPPKNVRGRWISATQYLLGWDEVTQRRDGSVFLQRPTYDVYVLEKMNNSNLREQSNYFIEMGNSTMLENLSHDAHYFAYVRSHAEGKSSENSTFISIVGSSGPIEMPDVDLMLHPAKLAYDEEEVITANCTISASWKHEQASMFELKILSDGEYTVAQDNATFVTKDIKLKRNTESVMCFLTYKNDTRHKSAATRNILIKFGPIVSVSKPLVHPYQDGTAVIICTVAGYPQPVVHFEKDGKKVGFNRGEVILANSRGTNVFQYTLGMQNAVSKAGQYDCVAEQHGMRTVASAELSGGDSSTQTNPALTIYQCCENKQISASCIEICIRGRMSNKDACQNHTTELLHCAEDIRDHSTCCANEGVKGKCLALCSGDAVSNPDECSKYATAIIGCFVREQVVSQLYPPTDINAERLSTYKYRISWKTLNDANVTHFFKVFVQPDSGKGEILETTKEYIDILVKHGVSYTIGVASLNARAKSVMAFTTLSADAIAADSGAKVAQNTWSRYVFGIAAILALAALIFGILYLAQNKRLPHIPFIKRRNIDNTPPVSFENPAFDSHVAIHFGGPVQAGTTENDWQSHDLQPANATSSNPEYANSSTFRYSKLES